MIQIRSLRKSFGSQVVLSDINLEIERGETIAVVGPSGTGKSVLLKIITGLLEADSGEVLIDGQSMTLARSSALRREICRRMGILFQNAALFDSLTLLENVAFPLRYHGGLSEKEITRKSIDGLEEVGLSGYEMALPAEVSIGMRKRVGIARALVTDPDILLFDEPNTGLDPETGQEIYELIIETRKTSGFTGIVISHEIPEVFQVCSRVAMMYNGTVQEESSVTEFLSSTNPIITQFRQGDIEGPIAVA